MWIDRVHARQRALHGAPTFERVADREQGRRVERATARSEPYCFAHIARAAYAQLPEALQRLTRLARLGELPT